MRIHKINQQLRMPWKNGLGTSTQIAISPESADFTKGDFLWRISSAEIFNDNLFSIFPNHDRILTHLSGGELELSFQNNLKPNVLLKQHMIYSWNGAEQIQCKLLGESATDLGIIYHRELIETSMSIVTVSPMPQKILLKAEVNLIIPIEDEIFFDGTKILKLEALQIETPTNKLHEYSIRSSTRQASKLALIQIRRRT